MQTTNTAPKAHSQLHTRTTPSSEGALPSINVAVIEDGELWLEAMVAMVQRTPGLSLVASAESVEQFESRMQVPPDVVVLDLHLPGLTGHHAVAHLTSRRMKVLVVSVDAARHEVVAAMHAGATGYLTKNTRIAQMVDAIHEIAAGRTHVSPRLAGFLLAEELLTARECEVLRVIHRGETIRDTAEELGLTESGIRGHLDRIRAKIGHNPRRPSQQDW